MVAVLGLAWWFPAWSEGALVVFKDASEAAGIRFVHEHGGSGEKYMVETMGSGACFLDYDDDGDPDLYLVQGAALAGFQGATDLTNVLYRNEGLNGDGMVRFRDVTTRAGVGDPGWGMGCAAADIDGDTDIDLLVTNFGPDRLYRNEGDGTFTDITQAAGVGDSRWSASAAFADADADGDLDLYVTHYVDHTIEADRPCGTLLGQRSYCPPGAYSPVPDSFYRNRGDGTFAEEPAAVPAGSPGNGLGVVWSDLNQDQRPDIYVANDSSPNFLFVNQGGTFREEGLIAGVAVNDDGRWEAGMGVEAADLNGDGLVDLFVTHLAMETNTFYRNLGNGQFADASLPSGLGPLSYRLVGFGTAALDFDLDGDLDLLVVNGHVEDTPEDSFDNITYAQQPQLLENTGNGRFRDTGSAHGAIFSERLVGRGLALADVDRDGDLDAVMTTSRGRARLLLASGAAGSWIELDLRQKGPNPLAVGARVTLRSGSRMQVREVRTSSSYLSQNDRILHAGLAGAREALVDVQWPGGPREMFGPLRAGRLHRLQHGTGHPANSTERERKAGGNQGEH